MAGNCHHLWGDTRTNIRLYKLSLDENRIENGDTKVRHVNNMKIKTILYTYQVSKSFL